MIITIVTTYTVIQLVAQNRLIAIVKKKLLC